MSENKYNEIEAVATGISSVVGGLICGSAMLAAGICGLAGKTIRAVTDPRNVGKVISGARKYGRSVVNGVNEEIEAYEEQVLAEKPNSEEAKAILRRREIRRIKQEFKEIARETRKKIKNL